MLTWPNPAIERTGTAKVFAGVVGLPPVPRRSSPPLGRDIMLKLPRFLRGWFWKENIGAFIGMLFDGWERAWRIVRPALIVSVGLVRAAAWCLVIVGPITLGIAFIRIHLKHEDGSDRIQNIYDGLLVEGIGVFVELLAVYLVVDALIRYRDNRKWKPMRERFYEVIRDEFIGFRERAADFLSSSIHAWGEDRSDSMQK